MMNRITERIRVRRNGSWVELQKSATQNVSFACYIFHFTILIQYLTPNIQHDNKWILQ